mgnify:CR=1 FL=1
MTQAQIEKINKYINSLRNKDKKEYAKEVFKALRYNKEIPENTKLSYIVKQSITANIYAAMGKNLWMQE